MHIERTGIESDTRSSAAKAKPYCPLECENCTGICLSVLYLLSPDERTALHELMNRKTRLQSRWSSHTKQENRYLI